MIKPILTTAATLLALSTPAFAEGDAEKGEKVFKKCKACHEVGEDAKNKVGPTLNGIIGAPAGANADFKYSDALMEKAGEGLVWDEANLTAFLTKPKDFLPKTKMSFAGLRKEQDFMDVFAYRASFE